MALSGGGALLRGVVDGCDGVQTGLSVGNQTAEAVTVVLSHEMLPRASAVSRQVVVLTFTKYIVGSL